MTSINKKTIFKNSFLLYLRMFFIMAVSLYTSRLLLRYLGIDNFGIFNLVGGIISMLNILTAALTNAINRYLTFELGRKNETNIQHVFSTSINVMILLSIIVFLMGEFVFAVFFDFLNIPTNRVSAAMWIYQFSLFTFCINIISVPYNSLIISYERMSAYAVVSIFDALLKLFVVYLLAYSVFDKLIFYGILLFLEAIIIRIIYSLYCKCCFKESRYTLVIDKKLIKSMLSFAGWNFFGQGASIMSNYGLNIVVNIFFGVVINAARGIAMQVNSALTQFVNSFSVAMNPQIIKSYAEGNVNGMIDLVKNGAKISFILMLMFVVPIYLEGDYILELWLGKVPQYTVEFVRMTLIIALINTYNNTIVTTLHATGKLRKYMIVTSIVEFLILPLSSLACFIFSNPLSIYYISIVVYVFLVLIRLVLVAPLVDIKKGEFIIGVYVRTLMVAVLSVCFPMLVLKLYESSFYRLIVVCFVSWGSIILWSYLVGFNNVERNEIRNLFINRLKKKNN